MHTSMKYIETTIYIEGNKNNTCFWHVDCIFRGHWQCRCRSDPFGSLLLCLNSFKFLNSGTRAHLKKDSTKNTKTCATRYISLYERPTQDGHRLPRGPNFFGDRVRCLLWMPLLRLRVSEYYGSVSMGTPPQVPSNSSAEHFHCHLLGSSPTQTRCRNSVLFLTLDQGTLCPAVEKSLAHVINDPPSQILPCARYFQLWSVQMRCNCVEVLKF